MYNAGKFAMISMVTGFKLPQKKAAPNLIGTAK
jgi:hypothetical protein